MERKSKSRLLKLNVTWLLISKLGENKVINQAYIYLIAVPILAKFLSKIKSPLILTIGGNPLTFDFELPFSWKLFYLSAIFFALASTLYAVFSPTIINENKSFGEFLRQRKNFTHLFDYLGNLGITQNWISTFGITEEDITRNSLFVFEMSMEDGTVPVPVSDKDVERIELYRFVLNKQYESYGDYNKTMQGNIFRTVGEGQLEAAFWKIYEYANSYRSRLTLIISIFYLLGLLLILYVFIENIIAVFSL